MKYNPGIHNRKSIRLKGYDYSQDGAYFVTICVQNKECLFGEIVDGEMYLNEIGKIIQKQWKQLPKRFSNIKLDEFIIMPNHFHGIVVIENKTIKTGQPQGIAPTCFKFQNARVPLVGTHSQNIHSIGNVIGAFKSLTTNEYICRVKLKKIQPFAGRIWQRNYYEHIITNEKSWEKIKNYIIQNPERWKYNEFFMK